MKQELEDMLEECTEELSDIEKYLKGLSDIEKHLKKLPRGEASNKVRNYLTKYALIKASGTAEYTYRSIVADHFSQLNDSRIDTYLDKTVKRGSRSATYNKMMELLGQFDDQWKSSFKNEVDARSDGERLKYAAASLVKNRHDFAHGRNSTVSFQQIKQYYEDVVKLIRIFDSVVR